MSKINKILLFLIVILVVAFGAFIVWQKGLFGGSYWAVYLSSGDLYFGQLHRFPDLTLSNVWYLQRNAQDPANPFSLVKFEQALWKPENEVYLNEKDIVWKAKLQDSSPVLQAIKNQVPASTSTLPK